MPASERPTCVLQIIIRRGRNFTGVQNNQITWPWFVPRTLSAMESSRFFETETFAETQVSGHETSQGT